MKNNRFLLPSLALAILAVCVMLGCAGPIDPYVPPQPPPDTSFDPSVLHPLRTEVPNDFIRGADISNCFEIEQYGGKYRNFDGKVEDIMKILADSGVNYVRVRLWINPDLHEEHYAGDGNNRISVSKVIAARAKAAGMKFLLNYHYSDWWADPQNQQIPADWKDLKTKDELYFALYQYTIDTINEFKAAGAEPDMVQIGNEIRSGFLRDHGGASADGTGVKLITWRDFSEALSYGSQAVRLAAPNAKIMIHFDSGGDSNILNTFEGFTDRSDNGRPATYTSVDYDVVGLSWYPFWSSHRSIDALYSNIREFKRLFGKEVVVCESGYSWTLQNFDSMGNYVGMQQENASFAPMTNINGFTSDSGVLFGTRPDGVTRYLPSTPENQARVYRAFMDAVVAAGGDGVMWWGADWIAPVSGLRSNSEMATLFDNTGKALPVLKVLGGIKGADVEAPGLITGLAAASTNGAVRLTWDAVNIAIASEYEVQRATTADGPWTTVRDNLDGGEYEDTGLAKDTTYYYRIRGRNNNGWGDYCKPVSIVSFIPTGLSISSTIDTATLTWNDLIGANKYGVQRATSATGPWTTVTDNVTGTTYTDTGLSPSSAYYFRIRAFSDDWGDYCDPAQTATLSLSAPEYFRVSDSTADSTTLSWLAVDGAASYTLYGAVSAAAPDDGAYAEIANNISGETYTHSGLTGGDVWWYKVSAVYTSHGEGPKSAATSFSAGAAVDLKADIDMASGSLDFAFSDPQKAASTTDIRPKVDSSAVYTFNTLYVANDADNLYIAMQVPVSFGAYQHDRFVLLIDNTASDTGAGTEPAGVEDGIAVDEEVIGTVEARVYMNLIDWRAGPQGVDGAQQNISAWSEDENNVWTPAAPVASPQIVKFAIPLAGIENPPAGTELKVFAAFSMGWSEGTTPYPGSFAPQSAVGSNFSDAWTDSRIVIDMAEALSYLVK